MITFTQQKNRSYAFMGINPNTDSLDVTNAVQDVNQAMRLIEASGRRYWTRGEFTADLVAGQQYYTLPAEVVRCTTVRANTGDTSYNWPVDEVDSEPLWNRFNVIPSNTVIVPQFTFIRGTNELGMYPVPSTDTTGGLIVSCELRANDMGIDDITNITVTTNNGSQYITSPSSDFQTNMVGMVFSTTDGADGKWYRVAAATSSQLTLENAFEGPTNTTVPCIIGQAPLYPEAYHMAGPYFAAYQFYLKRNDDATALATYKALYEDLTQKYKEAYAVKTTGLVQKQLENNIINIFWIPPVNLTD